MASSWQSDNYKPPMATWARKHTEGATNGIRTVQCVATNAVFDLGTAWLGSYVDFDAESANVRLRFAGTDAGLIVINPTGTDITTSGALLYAGSPKSWRITAESRYMATLAASTTYLTMYRSSPGND